MKSKVYGHVLKARYIIDWHWDDKNDYEDILNNTEKYLIVTKYFKEYEEINAVTIPESLIRVSETKIDLANNEILYYTNYPVRVIEATEEDRIKEIEYTKKVCRDHLDYQKEILECNEKKWYKFWK